MRKNILIILILLGFFSSALAQNDTLRVMQYNLMYYGQNTSFCTQSNNNIDDKNAAIRTILTAYYPDIFTVCEMGKSTTLPTTFLNNVLNVNGANFWMARGGANTTGSSTLTNCIFYNSTKLTLVGQHVAQSTTRDIDVYDFKFKNDDSNKMTLTCVIAHLKAGTGTDNVNKRKVMAEQTMTYLENNYRDKNVLIMGDFNLYTNTEGAYQAFTNQSAYPDAYFIDPLYPYGVGAWNNNGTYSSYHTQSTHKYEDDDCHSSGGMDDRFDFILMSENIYGGREGVRYIGGSYNALGNDGRRFNKSINDPTNTAVSQAVADALFTNSDHIPVTMELLVQYNIGVDEYPENVLCFDVFPNPASENISIRFYQDIIGKANILLFNTLGQMVCSSEIFVDDCLSEHVVPVDNLPKGLYFLKITNADGLTNTSKVIVE